MTVFDRSLLPPARFEMVVLSDTHYLLHPELQGGEWKSILEFPSRAERALQLAGALEADFVVHLGDVTHEYPETGEAVASRRGAQAQFAQYGLRPYVAAGNMDIGDKPDPTSPANWVTPETLAGWDAIFGRSWFSFDEAGIHGVVLNSCIMEGPLPEAAQQRAWAEADLAAHHGERIFLFMHHPPFFVDPQERAYGMYNSLDEPARAWLLGLIRQHRVEVVFAGHTHFVAINHLDGTRFFAAPSTTTSRAGLPEAFTVLPPDLGRSDLPKLGFYLVRETAAAAALPGGRPRGPSVQLIRTGDETPTRPALDPADPRRLVLTPPSRDVPHARLGVVATHPLGHMTPGPTIWPSVVRQRVRNDWSPMALLELGARRVRVPESDLSDESESRRLPVLRAEGLAVTASWLWSPRLDLSAAVAAHAALLNEVEVVHPGAALPEAACLAQLRSLRGSGLPVTLSAAVRETPIPPQYHGRTRIGFRVAELAELDAWLARHDCRVDRVACRLSPRAAAWQTARQIAQLGPLASIGAVDLALDLPDQREEGHAALAAEALFSAASLLDGRLWIAPLIDLDRSFDTAHGLLDRLSNPRPVFTALRLLNAALFSGVSAQSHTPLDSPAQGILGLQSQEQRLWLCQLGAPLDALRLSGRARVFHLTEGTSEEASAAEIEQARKRSAGPVLVMES
ncbi:MAG TPA: metallophosphoesterase [Chloroflexota bacterium]|nr:metallophosphoesterase [Chloroflexota bacterium]